jgi:hypothetical protein
MGTLGSYVLANSAFKKLVGSSITESLTDFILTGVGVDKQQTLNQIQSDWHSHIRQLTGGDALSALIDLGIFDLVDKTGQASAIWRTGVQTGSLVGADDPLRGRGFVVGDLLFGISPQGGIQQIGQSTSTKDKDFEHYQNPDGGGLVEKNLREEGIDLNSTDGTTHEIWKLENDANNVSPQTLNVPPAIESPTSTDTARTIKPTAISVGVQQPPNSSNLTTGGLVSDQIPAQTIDQTSGLQLAALDQQQGLQPAQQGVGSPQNIGVSGNIPQQPVSSSVPQFDAPKFSVPRFNTPKFNINQSSTQQPTVDTASSIAESAANAAIANLQGNINAPQTNNQLPPANLDEAMARLYGNSQGLLRNSMAGSVGRNV